jgi:hypothetical protein
MEDMIALKDSLGMAALSPFADNPALATPRTQKWL